MKYIMVLFIFTNGTCSHQKGAITQYLFINMYKQTTQAKPTCLGKATSRSLSPFYHLEIIIRVKKLSKPTTSLQIMFLFMSLLDFYVCMIFCDLHESVIILINEWKLFRLRAIHITTPHPPPRMFFIFVPFKFYIAQN